MAERIPLDNGGCLMLSEHGTQVKLTVSRGLDQSGLYKAWLHGSCGEYLLGTLSPEQGQLCLTRTVSKDTLMRAGCWPVTGGRTALAFPFSAPQTSRKPVPVWRWEHHPGSKFSDSILRESAANWGSMLIRYTDKGFQLAAPFDPHYPFPITPLFCFGTVEQIDGQPHIVYSFNPDGEPFPELDI